MARSRNIKPGFFENEDLADCGPYAMLLFAGLWTLADREGRLEDRPRRIKAQILPYFDVDADDELFKLDEAGFITRYMALDGQRYIQIVNFNKHQAPHIKEAPSTIPAPDSPDTSTDEVGAEAPTEQATDPQSPHEINDIDEHGASTRQAPPDSSLLIPDSLIADSGLPTPPTPRKRGAVRVAYPPEFEIFWSEVVRKEPSKAKALDCWRRALKREDEDGNPWTPEIILAGLRRFIPVWQVMELDKVPYITTWLNQDRFTATPAMPKIRLVQGPSQDHDKAMQMWLRLCRAKDGSQPWKRSETGRWMVPDEILDAAAGLGGIDNIDPANEWQRRDFLRAVRALEVAS